MKKILTVASVISIITACLAQEQKRDEKTPFIVSYEKDGKTVWDTVLIEDSVILNEYDRMVKEGPNYKRPVPNNDTVYNSAGFPELVKLDAYWNFGATTQRFEYDSLNRLIKTVGFDDKGQVKPYHQDIAMETHAYDSNGNRIETRYYGEDGKPVRMELVGPAVIRMTYNEKNQLIEERYLDENEKPLADFALIKYQYKGEQILVEKFNGKGEKIK